MIAVSQPSGTVTLVFTDIEGSTKLLDELGMDGYRDALAEHRRIVREACSRYSGYEVDYEGDAFFYAFSSASDAVSAVSDAMAGLEPGPISIRVGIHTGEPGLDPPKYVGMDVHTAARIMSSGHGGQVVVSPSTAKLVDIELTELGEHRLKDIAEAIPLFQLGEGSFPPLKTISNTNLPRPASSFLGREAELQEVVSRITGGARLVTLTGPGGTGKTRLALEAASSLVGEYKAGVFWVGVASLRDPALVLETISQVLGAKDDLVSHIATRELLLLLDNLEQVIEAAPDLSGLLQACPNLTLLVTSRELLRITGEVEYGVPPLAAPEAIELFCARARLEPSDEIAELCARLDSLPLAVELAAARTAALTPAQILERLAYRLDLLKGGRDADPRQQTLRATIEWSYELLPPDEQQLFARLSVFAGGCTLEAAEEVCDADLDTLQSLVEKSLLRFTDGRYWMLETIREYARQRLDAAGSADALRRRYLGHFVQLAEVAEPELWAQQYGERLRELDAEEANFRSALDWAIQQGDELALRLAGSLYPFWEIRAQHREARAWLTQALALGDDTALPARAKALIAAGRATAWQFDWPAAIVLLEDAAALSRELDDTEGVGRCLGFIGHARLFMGDSQGAAAALTGAVELARKTGDLGSLARALYNAAFAPIEQRNFDHAGAMFEEAAAISRAEDMSLLHALSLLHLGYTAILAGDPELAAMRLDETADLLDDFGKTMWSPVAQRYRALLALLGGRIDDASSLLRASLVQAREEGPQQDLPNWMEEIAAIAAARGDGRRAATLWGATEAMFEKRGLQVREENRQVRERFADDLDRSLAGDLSAAAREDGRAMTLEQAVEYALASID